jgi:cytochrome c-type biogenesis protein CcmF
LLAISINASASYSGEKVLHLGESQQFHGFNLALTDVYAFQQENYVAKAANIQVSTLSEDGFRGATLYPEIRLYPVEQQQTSEAAILHRPLYDFYISLIELEEDGTAVLRLYYKPMIGWLWLGCALIAMGGVYRIISIVLRRML